MIKLKEDDVQPLFVRGPSLGTRLVLLVVLSIVLMMLDSRRVYLDSIRNALSVAVYPIRALVDLPFSSVAWLQDTARSRSTLLSDNASLRTEQLAASVQLQRLAALEAENARLRALMDSSAKVPDRVLVGEILSLDPEPSHHRIVIDKGQRDGAYRGQALLDAHGIVGQITRVGPFSAEAVLVSDASHALPVEVNRTGLRTIAVGTGDLTRMSLPHLPNNADVVVGDLLVSSGLGGSFPAGYPVATISTVERDPGEPFASVTATPTAALNRSREVLLVWAAARTADSDVEPAEGQLAEAAPQ